MLEPLKNFKEQKDLAEGSEQPSAAPEPLALKPPIDDMKGRGIAVKENKGLLPMNTKEKQYKYVLPRDQIAAVKETQRGMGVIHPEGLVRPSAPPAPALGETEAWPSPPISTNPISSLGLPSLPPESDDEEGSHITGEEGTEVVDSGEPPPSYTRCPWTLGGQLAKV